MDPYHLRGFEQATGEDGLTYTLLPALQAAFGIADHCNFVHSGSADITIPVRHLARVREADLDPDERDVFVAEAKKGANQTDGVSRNSRSGRTRRTTSHDMDGPVRTRTPLEKVR